MVYRDLKRDKRRGKGTKSMFSKFFYKQKLNIYAPLSGDVISLDEVPDPVFSERMLGEGVCINPIGGNVCAPCDGFIIHLANTKHAIGIQAIDGTEILVHVGLDTVSLEGQGFTACVEKGESVKKGQLLVKVDWDYLREKSINLVTPVVVTNSTDKKILLQVTQQAEEAKTILMTVTSN